MNLTNFYKYSCYFILFSIFLTPNIRVPGLLNMRVEELFMLPWLVVFYFFYRKFKISLLLPTRAVILLIFSILIITSISMGSLYQLPTSIFDLAKFVWLFKAIFIYVVFYNYIYLDQDFKQRQEKIIKAFVYFGVISSFICFQQYFDILGLNAIYTPIVSPTQAHTLMPGYSSPRVIGMIGNPNMQGLVLLLCLLAHTYLVFENKMKSFYFFILFAAMIMTLSRTALITYVGAFMVLFFLYNKNLRFTLYKYIAFGILTTFLIMLFLFLKDNEVVYNLIIFRFELLANGIEENSFSARFYQWKLNIQYFLSSPIFGVGPLPRADIFDAADNEWLLLLRTYGLVGTLWIVIFMFFPVMMIGKLNKEQKNVRALNLSVIAATVLFMIPAGVITSTLTFPFVLVLLATFDYSRLALVTRCSSNTSSEPLESAIQT